MYPYSILQWFFFFYIYCFIGWCWETFYVSLKKKKLVNRGFIHGPFLPIYGTGAIMMLVVSAPFQDRVLLTFVAGMVGATVLELFTGTLMELLFKVRYWDYSHQPLNYKGYICLSSTVAWGILTIILTTFLHSGVAHFVQGLPPLFVSFGTAILSCYLVIDFAVSFKGALDLRTLLDKMERAKEELKVMERRLDAMIAFSTSKYVKGKQENSKQQKLRFTDFRKRINVQRRRIFGNPTMVSKRYQQSLNELKQMVSDFRKKNK